MQALKGLVVTIAERTGSSGSKMSAHLLRGRVKQVNVLTRDQTSKSFDMKLSTPIWNPENGTGPSLRGLHISCWSEISESHWVTWRLQSLERRWSHAEGSISRETGDASVFRTGEGRNGADGPQSEDTQAGLLEPEEMRKQAPYRNVSGMPT